MPTSRDARSIACLLLTCGTLGGCGTSSTPDTLGRSGPELAPANFVDRDAKLIEVDTPPPRRPVTPDMIRGPIAASGGVLDVTARPGRPSDLAPTTPSDGASGLPTSPAGPGAAMMASSAAVTPAGPVALVDMKVGDINGKPVYANAFLDDMADQLRAETTRMRREEWLRFTRGKIEDKLNREIRDELLRAEAIGNFTPEQKQGFFAFMKNVQERVQSQSQGSRAAAEERIETAEGLSLDQYMKRREQEELIGFQLREKIEKRVSVPWRDIRQEYERFFETFNPPPRAKFHLVQIPAAKTDVVEAFSKRLAAGESFLTLAADAAINAYKPDSGGLEEREVKGDRTQGAFFGNEALNAAARTTAPGQVAGPMTVGENTTWLFLESIDQKTRSLYDAQMDIESVLKRRRTTEATDRYIAHLRERASISSTSEMARQLLTVADGRFWPASSPR
ncbi:MAG: hypothetical protein WCK33_10405 [Phycisphaerae bacterium]